LGEFARQAWAEVEPAEPLIWNWHLDAIAEHLEAVTRGQIENLIINIGPGFAKSLMVAVFWPCWCWINEPTSRWLFASYSYDLSARDSRRCRHLIRSEWYQQNFGDRFKLITDAESLIENDRSGWRIPTSTGGIGTGFRAHYVVADDPNNVKKAESEADRETTNEWYDKAYSNRFVDYRKPKRVIIQQRVHDNDLSGHELRDVGGYEHLRLPTEFEPKHRCITSIPWSDPRKAEGEPIFPQRFGQKEIDDAKRSLGTTGYAGQHQQRPVPAGGAIFKGEWFKTVEPHEVPPLVRSARGWDKAATEAKSNNDPDWTAGVKIGLGADGFFYVTDVRRTRASSFGVETFVRSTAEHDGIEVRIRLEQEPGSSGKGEAERYVWIILQGFPVHALPSTGDKATRAAPLSSAAEAGRVRIVRANWNDAFLDELMSFPKGNHDDQVDAASNAFEELNNVVALEEDFFMAASG
jgi:predicted phage terminase large subunit-like protein